MLRKGKKITAVFLALMMALAVMTPTPALAAALNIGSAQELIDFAGVLGDFALCSSALRLPSARTSSIERLRGVLAGTGSVFTGVTASSRF